MSIINPSIHPLFLEFKVREELFLSAKRDYEFTIAEAKRKNPAALLRLPHYKQLHDEAWNRYHAAYKRLLFVSTRN